MAAAFRTIHLKKKKMKKRMRLTRIGFFFFFPTTTTTFPSFLLYYSSNSPLSRMCQTCWRLCFSWRRTAAEGTKLFDIIYCPLLFCFGGRSSIDFFFIISTIALYTSLCVISLFDLWYYFCLHLWSIRPFFYTFIHSTCPVFLILTTLESINNKTD